MKTDQIREIYLDFFKKKGHIIVPSDSLVPQNDPTLLFTGAGMNQFKDYFLGLKKDLKRAASSQKCLRTADLEEVGKTAYHHSFFEMLGNFSFGDYFKEEAIGWAWELLTEKFKIAPKRLRISVHESDAEAYKIWEEKIGVRPHWIYKKSDRSNFWPANAPKDGPNGPCGPCSEIYYDQDPNHPYEGDIEDRRFAEIWNLVFTQYDRQDGGKLVPLVQKNIDTGMGLERLACVLQGKQTNYEIDIFQPINESIEKKIGAKVLGDSRRSLYAISDHLRAVVFAIADGVIPSNEGRGYVIRKLIRKAIGHSFDLAPSKNGAGIFLDKIVPVVISTMSGGYPELQDAEKGIVGIVASEGLAFEDAIQTGNEKLRVAMEEITRTGGKTIPGDIAFKLYDTYGFPLELTRTMAEKKGMKIDQNAFDALMEGQRKRAKAAAQISGEIFVTTDLEKKLSGLQSTVFLGYQTLQAAAKVLLAEIENRKGVLVLDQTPFYAESGGQVGDHGRLKGKNFEAEVLDVQNKDIHFIHHVEMITGTVKAGDAVECSVDSSRRARIMRNHTATHLLHAALRKFLGEQARQLGSLVGPDKLRFDYSYSEPLPAELIKKIEDDVMAQILMDTPVAKEEKSIEEAKQEGAIAFFGEKYGTLVRVVTVSGYSKELCGGTHCDRTGQIGCFMIASDSSIGSGTRRIEALTGEGTIDYMRTLRCRIQQISKNLRTTPDHLVDRIVKLQDNLKKLEKGKDAGKLQTVDAAQILAHAKPAGAFQVAIYCDQGLAMDELRRLSDDLRSRASKTVYFLAAEKDEKIQFLLGMSPDLKTSGLDMVALGKQVGSLLEANSGGRIDLVQGGAANKGPLSKKRDALEAKIFDHLKLHQVKN